MSVGYSVTSYLSVPYWLDSGEGRRCLACLEGFEKKNWEGHKEKVCTYLFRWKLLLPHLSYRGRVLVVNNLVASSLWH